MTARRVKLAAGHDDINVVPGVPGRRAFPIAELRRLDPFVMLDHIGPATLDPDFVTGGPMHPHRGFETLTILLEGVMHHVDSSGFEETLSSGSTQNMRAGSGIQHGGDMAVDPDTFGFHEVQLWVNMPAATKMTAPAIASAALGDKPLLQRDNHTIEILAGSIDGHASPLATTQPTTVARIRTTAPGPITIEWIPSPWNAAIYVLQGTVDVTGRPVTAGQTVVLDTGGDTIELTATGPDADLLLLSGEPIGEPVAMGGPFVMNTPAEIDQANADYAAGLFDNVTLADTSARP